MTHLRLILDRILVRPDPPDAHTPAGLLVRALDNAYGADFTSVACSARSFASRSCVSCRFRSVMSTIDPSTYRPCGVSTGFNPISAGNSVPSFRRQYRSRPRPIAASNRRRMAAMNRVRSAVLGKTGERRGMRWPK